MTLSPCNMMSQKCSGHYFLPVFGVNSTLKSVIAPSPILMPHYLDEKLQNQVQYIYDKTGFTDVIL